jgi:hypothetical protein
MPPPGNVWSLTHPTPDPSQCCATHRELLNAPDELPVPLDVEPLRLALEEHLLDHPERMRDLKLFLMKQTIMLFSS